MKNDYAVYHARRLHAQGIDHDTIDNYLRILATRAERREIIATLDAPTALAA